MYEDKTLVCNGNSKKILEEHFKRNPNEVQTVYIGVDEEKFNPEKYNKEELEQKYLGKKTNKKIATSYCRFQNNVYLCNRKTKTGKSYTASSLRILQGLIAAKVVGCSGAI